MVIKQTGLVFSCSDKANILNVSQYSQSVDSNGVYICHAIENYLHKQRCIIGLARTRKYNVLF